tara:strand:- start:1256 stop:1786 length:531 start_codon:yes stop_codon:yes gene_type:complete
VNYLSKVNKIIYCKSSNTYKVCFISEEYPLESIFNVLISDAKNIALAKENINSEKLKTYDFIISLFSVLCVEIDKFIISKKKNKIIASLYFKINKIENKLEISFVDAVILGIKTFSDIYIQKKLFNKNNIIKFFENDIIKNQAKINNLKNILKLLVKNEEFESAALLRNKINKIDN